MKRKPSLAVALSLVALIGAQTAAASWETIWAPPTISQAKHAIRNSDYRNENVGPCKYIGMNVSCVVTTGGCFDDQAFGTSTDVETTVVGVGPKMHVWTIVPTRWDIYAGGCPHPASNPYA